MKTILYLVIVFVFLIGPATQVHAKKSFQVIGFYTGKSDLAHISFVQEANRILPQLAADNHFIYDSTSDWRNMNDSFLARYQVVLFLDTRPEDPQQRAAFERYMQHGGGWIGFHFAAFALTPSACPQNWDWYHNIFVGSGQYVSNTWRPTAAVLRVETHDHAVTKTLPDTFRSAPNEWYRWSNDLTKNPAIKILASIDPVSFPLGTGPKAWEIWHEGYYPVVWTNIKYRMVYFNMGHNDMDYGKTNAALSFTLENRWQKQMLVNALLWLGRKK